MSIEDVKRNKVLKVKAEQDLLFFTRYIFKENHNQKFKIADHLRIIADTLHKVAKGDITRLIINIPPRYGKTELAVKMFIAWGLALNPKSKFIHLSYSDDLALDNSQFTKEYIDSEAYQKLWPVQLKKDSKSKKKWYTEQGGGVYATAAGGAVTGFGAGSIKEDEKEFKEILTTLSTLRDKLKQFSGAIIIDDPLKPDDAKSDVKRLAVNERYNNTIRSRVNDRSTPIIVIMQRLHEEDLSGFLLDGGSGEDWYHLKLSAIKEDGTALWPDKHTIEELNVIKKAAPYMFAGQMEQEPAPLDGGKIKREWFEVVDISEVPNNIVRNLYIDGAYTKKTTNDPTGLTVTGFDKLTNTLYVFNKDDQWLEMPELLEYVPVFAKENNLTIKSRTRIEPKASGKTLKQLLKNQTKLNSSEITGNHVGEGKEARVDACSSIMEAGRVKLVKGSWNKTFLDQLAMFPNAKHDEQVDNICYAIYDEFDELNDWNPILNEFKVIDSFPKLDTVMHCCALFNENKKSSLIKVGVKDNDLYIHELFCDYTTNHSSMFKEEIDSILVGYEVSNGYISALRNKEIVAWNNSMTDREKIPSANKLNEYNIFITEDSVNLIDNFKKFSYDVEANGLLKNTPKTTDDETILPLLALFKAKDKLW